MIDVNFYLLILTRTAAATLFGFGLGLERELTNKYAGLRTHILVCLGSCIFTILSIFAFPTAIDSTHPQAFGDPARIAAQVLTGIGFIGGGTVLRHGNSVYGLTTAATLWVAAAIGMACGAGKIGIGLITTILSVGVLVLIRVFEREVLPHNIKNTKRFRIIITCSQESTENIYDFIVENFAQMHEISKKKNDKEDFNNIFAIVDISGKKQIQSLYKKFQNIKGIESILIQEANE